MKRFKNLFIIVFVFGFNLLNVLAQVPLQQTRSADTIAYFLNNPNGPIEEFTWTITGGVIVGHSSPYMAEAADTIQVVWSDLNKTSANFGSLKVSKVVIWPGGGSCTSPEEKIDVESWVRPKAKTDTSELKICSGESFSVKVFFEGKPDYKYKWKLCDKDNPGIIVEDHTAEFLISTNSSTNILVAGIENYSNSEKIYEFEITDVQDGLTDNMPGDVSMARVTIYLQPKTSAGLLNNNNHLIRR